MKTPKKPKLLIASGILKKAAILNMLMFGVTIGIALAGFRKD